MGTSPELKLRHYMTLAAATALALLVSACTGSQRVAAPADQATTLDVLAGSELKDLEPFLGQIRDKTGVTLAFTYSGTLSGIDRINAGETHDVAWFSQAKYFVLSDTHHRIKAQTKIMLSPVILGVKQSKAKAFGWDSNRGVTWKDIAAKASSAELTYAMTNPAASNSGFSAVIGVASALAGTSDALKVSDVDMQRLNGFFRGQQLTAGSSGWLADSYVRDQDRLDGIINYEAALIALNKSGKLHEPLALIYPKEGIVTADYPLVLLNEQKKPLYDKVVEYLKSAEFQQTVMQQTYRRPANPDVKLSADFPKGLIVELPFPNNLAVVNAILFRYLNQNRIPAHSYFALDTSGSMEGQRIDGLRKALYTIAGDDQSITGQFAKLANREKVTMISFSSDVHQPADFEMHSADDKPTLQAVKNYADSLAAGGGTAIYGALERAIGMANEARKSDPGRAYSIVLMTDGENNEGDDLDAFTRFYDQLPQDQRVRIFPILFGEGNADDLQRIADLTGGRLFNGKVDSLAAVFKEIRGYQ